MATRTAFREIRYYQQLEHKRALHHDFFAIPAGNRFYFVFDAPLGHEQQQLLDLLDFLLKRVQYFGRAESRAVLRRSDLTAPPCEFYRVLPRERTRGTGWSPRPVLCPNRDFHASDLWAPRELAGNAADETGAPVHLVDALLSARKPLPDGSLRVEYAQPDGSIVHEIPAARAPRGASAPEITSVTSVRFRLCRRFPIPISEVVAVARAFREEAVRLFKTANPGTHSRALTGREDDGSVSRDSGHAYYLPQPAANGFEVATIVVIVPDAVQLTRPELEALMAVERIFLRWRDRYPITVLREQANGDGQMPSRRWRSLTPFLAPHHHRVRRARTCPDEQLAACIEAACGVSPAGIAVISGPAGAGIRTMVRAHEYGSVLPGSQLRRNWRLTPRFAHWYTVEFSAPVILPCAIGKDAHFGLGQFTSL